MNERIIDLSDEGAYLHVEGDLLVIVKKTGDRVTLPFEQVGVVMLAHPHLTLSASAIARIAQHKGMVVVCEHYLPVAMLLPVGTHSTAARNYALQTMVKPGLKKRLWSFVVSTKIRFQSDLLDRWGRTNPIRKMASLVQLGDKTNMEGHAARLYWEALFGEDFVRDREAGDANRFLNYGYTVLRACVARAICASGLHPSFGIYHHNQYNSYGLVDDLMEPFRPLVDDVVYQILTRGDGDAELTPSIKRELVGVLRRRVLMDGRRYELFDALSLVSSSLLASYEQGESLLRLPESLFE